MSIYSNRNIRRTSNKATGWACLTAIAVGVAVQLTLAGVFMLLWNTALLTVFPQLTSIDYGMAILIWMLITLVGGAFRSSNVKR